MRTAPIYMHAAHHPHTWEPVKPARLQAHRTTARKPLLSVSYVVPGFSRFVANVWFNSEQGRSYRIMYVEQPIRFDPDAATRDQEQQQSDYSVVITTTLKPAGSSDI
jgi:hypothetical protein